MAWSLLILGFGLFLGVAVPASAQLAPRSSSGVMHNHHRAPPSEELEEGAFGTRAAGAEPNDAATNATRRRRRPRTRFQSDGHTEGRVPVGLAASANLQSSLPRRSPEPIMEGTSMFEKVIPPWKKKKPLRAAAKATSYDDDFEPLPDPGSLAGSVDAAHQEQGQQQGRHQGRGALGPAHLGAHELRSELLAKATAAAEPRAATGAGRTSGVMEFRRRLGDRRLRPRSSGSGAKPQTGPRQPLGHTHRDRPGDSADPPSAGGSNDGAWSGGSAKGSAKGGAKGSDLQPSGVLPAVTHQARPKYRETGFNTVHATLKTVWGEHLHNHTRFLPHPKYPRPMLVRKASSSSSSTGGGVWWESLNGYWDYSVTAKDEASGPAGARSLGWAGKIRVPFPFESQLSGVGGDRVLEPSQFLWYRRSFRLSDRALGSSVLDSSVPQSASASASSIDESSSSSPRDRPLAPPLGPGVRYFLNFEAVDFACEVFVNDVSVGGHQGGSTPFRLDVSAAVASAEVPGARNDQVAHEVVVRVEDATGDAQARGKQSLRPRGIWYSRVSGIWQSVWLEAVPPVHVSKIKVRASLKAPAPSAHAKKGQQAPKANPFMTSSESPLASPLATPHGSFSVAVTISSAAPSTFNPRKGDMDDGADGKKDASDATDAASGKLLESSRPTARPWDPRAKLRIEVEVHAPGAMSAAAAGGFRPAVPSVVLSVDEPMGIVTRVAGEHLLIIGVKPGSQAAEAGVRPGAFVDAVGDQPVRSFADVQAALRAVRDLVDLHAATQPSQGAAPPPGSAGSRYYSLHLSSTVVVAKASCVVQGPAPSNRGSRMLSPTEGTLANSTAGPRVLSDLSAGRATWDTLLRQGMANKGSLGSSGSAARPLAWEAGCEVPSLLVSEPRLWSPDEPYLYDLKVTLWQDLGVDSTARRSNGYAASVLGSATGLSRGAFGRSSGAGERTGDTAGRQTFSQEGDGLSNGAPGSSLGGEDEVGAGSVAELVLVDEVWSYGAMREVGRSRGSDGHLRMTLNGQPLFHLGTLDQGWWPDGLLTPPSDAAQVHDIEFLKAAGYNMIRKHTKVENRRYYYHCDRLGMLVWQDMASADEDGRDRTSLSPEHWTRLSRDRPEEGTWDDVQHAQYMGELEAMVDALESHPCIAVWVPFNEAWGQHRTVEVAAWLMARDPSRLVDAASGGNFWPVGHLADNHNYPNPSFPFYLADRPDLDQPLQDYHDFVKVVGEFGGHGLVVPGHLWFPKAQTFGDDLDLVGIGGLRDPLLSVPEGKQAREPGAVRGVWGYGGLPKTTGEFKERYRVSLAALRELMDQGVAAGVYTQTTDVEGEVNGLLTYDRKVAKIDPRDLRDWHRALFNLGAPQAPQATSRRMRF